MNFLKKHKWKIAGIAITVLILVIAFMAGGEPSTVTEQEATPTPVSEKISITQKPEATPYETATPKPTPAITQRPVSVTPEPDTATPVQTPVSVTVDEKKDDTLTCTLTVRCDTILSNISKLKPEKSGLVPSDGVIFPKTEVIFNKGESVYNILVREMKKNKIHLEFVNVPVYNSAYIEGIANLYENDCGELSGWMYKVNGSFPGYGSSKYTVKDGDAIEWIYTCDRGNDIGGGYSPRNGRKDD
ncbi:MAG: DUF4430 domain-containing protein [Clostridia bacterium]|nr:DUF4430 domain-containing protein [Clostridia bacterium]